MEILEMNYHALWGSFLLAFIIALVLTPVTIWLAPKIGAMDVPKDDRRVHTKAVPRIGGIAIFIGIMVSFMIFLADQMPDKLDMWGILAGGLIIFAGGFIDDIHELSPKMKLIGQAIAGAAVHAAGIRLSFVNDIVNDFFTEAVVGNIAAYLCTVIWVVAIVNAMNLIDGLDGLAAGIAAISSLCIAYAGYIHGHYVAATAMLAVAGGALGFLPYNFNPARTFMGDCGAQFLGFCLAVLSLVQPVKSATLMAIILPVAVMALPIFDTIFAILRRLVRRKSIVEGDKEHLHHRIMRAGFGQKRSVLLLYCISGIMGVMAVAYSRQLMVECLGLLAIVVMLLYVLLSDTSTKNVEIHAVNIRKAEEKQKKDEDKIRKAEVKAEKAEKKAEKKNEKKQQQISSEK